MPAQRYSVRIDHDTENLSVYVDSVPTEFLVRHHLTTPHQVAAHLDLRRARWLTRPGQPSPLPGPTTGVGWLLAQLAAVVDLESGAALEDVSAERHLIEPFSPFSDVWQRLSGVADEPGAGTVPVAHT
jgi:hypothetical protein